MGETIFLAIVAAAPSIVALVGVVTAVVKLVKAFNSLKGEVVNVKEYSELKQELAQAHKENADLRKDMRKLMSTMDKVKRD